MKNYTKTIATGALTLMIAFAGTANAQIQNRPVKAYAAPHNQRPASMANAQKRPNVSMAKAQQTLKRTHFVLLKAHQAVKKNQVYTGDLAKAVAHQKRAKKYYAMKNPHRAILHSREARKYAFKVLADNKATSDVDKSYELNADEQAMMGVEDNSLSLEKDLEQTTFDDKTITDKEMTELEVIETAPEDYKNEK